MADPSEYARKLVARALTEGRCLKATRRSGGFVVTAERTENGSGYRVRYRQSNGWQDGVSISPAHMPEGAAGDFIREVGEDAARRAAS